MRLHLIIISMCVLLTATTAAAQVQRGVVKTKGRMVDGRHVPGKGLPGATVVVKGDNSVVVEHSDGSFNLTVSAKSFKLESVKKAGYVLVDADLLSKPFQCSENSIYLVMETPEQQLEDLLMAQEKINQGLKRQAQKILAENRRLRAENKISEEEYARNLQRIIAEQQDNGKLVEDMAARYAKMDYDQLDELGQRISNCILNGELTTADSLLRTKGDITVRVAQLKREWQELTLEKNELAQKQENTKQARHVLETKKEELAADCYSQFEIFKMQSMVDSAMHYLQARAELDTLRSEWLYDLAFYSHDNNYHNETIGLCERLLTLDPHNPDANNLLGIAYHETGQYEKSLIAFEEVVQVRRQQYAENQQFAPQLASSLMNLGNVYKSIGRAEDAERVLKESLALNRQQTQDVYGQMEVSIALHNLGALYAINKRYSEANTFFEEAVVTCRKCVAAAPEETKYQGFLAQILRLYGAVCSKIQRKEDATQMLEESISILQRLAKDNPAKYELQLANALQVMSIFLREERRHQEYEQAYEQIVELSRHYVQRDSLLYGPDLIQQLDTLAAIYDSTNRLELRDSLLMEKVVLYRCLVRQNPERFLPELGWDARALAQRFFDTRFQEGMEYCREAMATYERLCQMAPQYEFLLADVLTIWGDYCIKSKQDAEAEQAYLSAIELLELQGEDAPQNILSFKAGSMYMLAMFYYNSSKWSQSLDMLSKARDVYHKLAAQDPTQYSEDYVEAISLMAVVHEAQKNYPEAVAFVQEAFSALTGVESPAFRAQLHNNLAFFSILLGDYETAEKHARAGLQCDETMTLLNTNLALSLLLQGKLSEALPIYKQYAPLHREGMIDDLNRLEKEKLLPAARKADVEHVRCMLK